jgi:hypothetical protein
MHVTLQTWMNSRREICGTGFAWRTPRKSYLPQTPREWSSNLCCQRIDFLLPMFNQWTMDKKIYQALAKTHTTVKPELVYLHIGPR